MPAAASVNLAAVSWEISICNQPAKMLPEFWSSETVWGNKCLLFQAAKFGVTGYTATDNTLNQDTGMRLKDDVKSAAKISCKAMRECEFSMLYAWGQSFLTWFWDCLQNASIKKDKNNFKTRLIVKNTVFSGWEKDHILN